MRRTLIRTVSVGVLTGALVAVTAGSAFAAHGPGRFAQRFGGGFQARNGGPGGPGNLFGLGGFGGPVMRGGMGFGGPGGPVGPGGGAGVLNADVISAASTCLKISVTMLTSDLNDGKTLAQEATGNSSTAADLISCLVTAQTKVYDNEKAAGWITADQETALVKQYTAAVTGLVNNGPPVPPAGGQGGPLQLAADYLGVSVADLIKDFQNGESLADVVGNTTGKTVDGLVQAMLAPAQKKLGAAVTAGTITSAQESAIVAKMTTALTNLVNHKPGTHTSSTTTSTSMTKLLVKYTTVHRYTKRVK